MVAGAVDGRDPTPEGNAMIASHMGQQPARRVLPLFTIGLAMWGLIVTSSVVWLWQRAEEARRQEAEEIQQKRAEEARRQREDEARRREEACQQDEACRQEVEKAQQEAEEARRQRVEEAHRLEKALADVEHQIET